MNARGSNSSASASAPRTARDVLVLGVGNVIRGDDAIGLLLARDLAPVFSSVADFLECESAGYEILDRMTGRKAVVIIDALKTETESEVGDVVSLPVDDAPSSVTLMPSHGFDMTGLIRFFRHAHGESFPGRIHCILIKVTDVDEFREGLSPLLSALYPRLLDSLKALLREMIADEETLRAPG